MSIRTIINRLAALALLALAAPLAAQPYAYVPNINSNNVSVVNTATNAVTATLGLPGGANPFSVAANAAGTRVYIGNENNTISVIDTATNAVANAVSLPLSCFQGLAVNPAGNRGYAAGCNTDNVVVLDLTTNPVTVVANLYGGFYRPNGVVVSPDGSRVYVANIYGQNISVINAATNTVVGLISTPGREPYGIAIDASGSNLWISHDGSPNGVTRISDPAGTPVVSAGIATGANPRGIALNAAGNTLYVANATSNTVSAISTATLAITGSAATGSTPFGISVTPDGSRVLVANLNSHSVSVFNASLALQATVAVGSSPFSHGIFIAPTWLNYDARPEVIVLRDLVTAAGLTDTRLRNSLLAPLNAAITWLNGSDPNRVVNACSNLAKFISVVRQNIAAAKLSSAVGQPWIDEANDVLAKLNCPTR